MDIATFIARIPKAELHMHLEGSIEPEMVFALAQRNGIELRWDSAEGLRAAYAFGNLQDFLDLFYDGCRVLIEEQDFYDVTRAYLRRAHDDHVVHAEVFLSPQGHLRRGIAMATMMNGIFAAMADAEREDGIGSGLLLGAQRHLSEDDAFAMLEQAMPWADRILGFGLGGAELGNPPEKFTRFFQACREHGFHVTAHAGEEGPADYVRTTVNVLRVDRIDHGNACLKDPLLTQQLADRQIPLTVCPISNFKLQVVPSLKAHPLREMMDRGLFVTVNSDDPSFFGGYINDNLLACQQALDLTPAHIITLVRNSFDAAFMTDEKRQHYQTEIDAFAQRFAEQAV